MKLDLGHKVISFDDDIIDLGLNTKAWNGGEECLIRDLENQGPLPSCLIINERYGALSMALPIEKGVSLFDSAYYKTKSEHNYRMNNAQERIQSKGIMDDISGNYSAIVISPPKEISLLQHYITLGLYHLHDNDYLYIPFMDKHMSKAHIQLFESFCDEVFVSKGYKKGRYLRGVKKNSLKKKPLLQYTKTTYRNIEVINSEGVFASGRIDRGTQYLLDNLHIIPYSHRVLDLACGDGILGMSYKKEHSDCTIDFADASQFALDSTQLSLKANGLEARHLYWSSSYDAIPNENKYDLILLNPPYHMGNSKTTQIAIQMMEESYHHLKDKGELWVIANNHLGYDRHLFRQYSHCQVKLKNNKYHILMARKER
ncbi:class I SAM-dependent methyltransferase [Spirochaeta cellobiosiphila]|uniref:class I SAM-dependent methyltransferase n=1 Tax=Spirochaeta cellobiosiphila TaxID=504483 RepID=UPI0004138045|nr:methyltransferase [Spirochaeta cellobiosiphila]